MNKRIMNKLPWFTKYHWLDSTIHASFLAYNNKYLYDTQHIVDDCTNGKANNILKNPMGSKSELQVASTKLSPRVFQQYSWIEDVSAKGCLNSFLITSNLAFLLVLIY